jgi:hypothetical protein
VAVSASASPSLTWRLVAHGNAGGLADPLVGYVALGPPAASAFAARTGTSGLEAVGRVDFARNALVAVFGPFGCKDDRIEVASVIQRGRVLAVRLRARGLAPGTVECMGIFETFRLLTVPKAALSKPYPTRASVTLARA